MIRYFLPLAILVVVAGLFWVGLGLNPTVVPSPLVGKPVPEFTLPTLEADRGPFSHTDLRGRTTMVHVWATWCESCRAEHPLLMTFARRGLVPIVGLNYKDEDEAARRWLAHAGDPYELNLVDADGRVGIDWGVYGTPETFIVDRDGVIRFKQVGPLTERVIENELVPLLRLLEGSGE